MRKNIFFDFGRTIVEHPEDGAGIQIVFESGAKNIDDAQIIRDEVFSVAKYLNDLDEGLMSFDEYVEMVKNAVPERLAECAEKAARYNIDRLPLIVGMEELLQKLKADGFKLYITSNMNSRHGEQMRNHKIAKYFDGMLFSADIKTRKPSREFFETALEMFGVASEECIFIDDLEENVQGAQRCGICGFVFKGNAIEVEQFIYSNIG